jgi:hypothetical protein
MGGISFLQIALPANPVNERRVNFDELLPRGFVPRVFHPQ